MDKGYLKEWVNQFNNWDNTIPRRNRLDKNEPAELAINKAMLEVEKLGASEITTQVVTLLSQAKELLGDYFDAKSK